MKIASYLIIAILSMAITAPCAACFFEFEEDVGPVSTLKCSLNGFYAFERPEDQISLLERDLSTSGFFQTEAMELSDTSTDDEQEAMFLSSPEGNSPILRDDPSLNLRLGTYSLQLLEASYPDLTRRVDLSDFWVDPLGFNLEPVIDSGEMRDYLLFFRNLGKINRTTPNVELLTHKNCLAWRMVSTSDPFSNTYILGIVRHDEFQYIDLKAFTITPCPRPDFVRRVKSALGLILSSLLRETRSCKIRGYQFEVDDDNALMKAIVQTLDLKTYDRKAGLGTKLPSDKKHSHLDLTDDKRQLFYRYFKMCSDEKEFKPWFLNESEDSDN